MTTSEYKLEMQITSEDKQYEGYPELGIEEWHKKHGLYIENNGN